MNPEFNYEKLRKLHAQNISLSCGIPFVSSCDHTSNCVECHNILRCALTKTSGKKVDKATETSNSGTNKLHQDTPLRKIEAGLYDITKEIISLGIPMEENEIISNDVKSTSRPDVKHVHCQTESHSRSDSSRDGKHSDKKPSRHDTDRHRSKDAKVSSHKTEKQSDSRSSTDKRSRHSRSDRKSSGSSKSSHSHEKKRKDETSEEESSEEDRDKGSKRRRSSSNHDRERKKRSTSDKHSSESRKRRSEHSSKSQSSRERDTKRSKSVDTVVIDSDSDVAENNDSGKSNS